MKNQQQKFLIVFTYYEGEFLRTKERTVGASSISAAVERIKGEYKRFADLKIHKWEKVEK